jgi:hypothetical protein
MRWCSATRIIALIAIEELNLGEDQRGNPSPILYLRNGNEISLTEEGYDFVLKTLNPIEDGKEIIGDGLGENQL